LFGDRGVQFPRAAEVLAWARSVAK
jgi:hypothetical protein